MWRWLLVIWIAGPVFAEFPESFGQCRAQLFELADLRLLTGQRIIQSRQQVLLVGQLRFDFDDSFVIH